MDIEERLDLLEATVTKLAKGFATDLIEQRDRLHALAADFVGAEYALRAMTSLISAPAPVISRTLLHAYDALSDTLEGRDATFRQQSLATFDVFAALLQAHTGDPKPTP